MIDFNGDMRRFSVVAKTRLQILHKGSAARALRGIRLGDSLTGAPGQPVDKEKLRPAWQMRELNPNEIQVAPEGEPVKWAQQNEDGIARPSGGLYRLLSKVGGRFSVAKTIAGWPSIVRHITAGLGSRP